MISGVVVYGGRELVADVADGESAARAEFAHIEALAYELGEVG